LRLSHEPQLWESTFFQEKLRLCYTYTRSIRKTAKKLGELDELDCLIFSNKHAKLAKLLIFHLANISTRQSNYTSIPRSKKVDQVTANSQAGT
jgi:hypothetical protein